MLVTVIGLKRLLVVDSVLLGSVSSNGLSSLLSLLNGSLTTGSFGGGVDRVRETVVVGVAVDVARECIL